MKRGKVLIVEDQDYFRKGLRKLIDKTSLEWEVVGEAENGKEALDLIEYLKPDLILTDIRMPILDGLQLAEQLNKKEPGILLVIITGYKDFEYAQTALRYGAFDLLLKPCSETDIRRMLSKVYARFREAIVLKEKQIASIRNAEENTLRSLLLRMPHNNGIAIQLHDQIIGKTVWFMKVDSYFPPNKSYRPNDIQLLQFAVLNIIQELLNIHDSSAFFLLVDYDKYALLFQHTDESGDRIEQLMKDNVFSYIGLTIEAIRMGQISKLDELASFYVHGFMTRHPGAELHRDQLNSTVYPKIEHAQVELVSNVLLGRTDYLRGDIEKMMREINHLPLLQVKIETLKFVTFLQETASKHFGEYDMNFDIGAHIDQLQSFQTTVDVMKWLRQRTEQFLFRCSHWNANKSENVVQKVIHYITKNYMNDCSLTKVSNYVHLNPSYFSNLFKKETGENFSNYLSKIRMEKAQILLRNTDMKISEIAESVGYDDPNYFTNVFKLHFHQSPSEYRKST